MSRDKIIRRERIFLISSMTLFGLLEIIVFIGVEYDFLALISAAIFGGFFAMPLTALILLDRLPIHAHRVPRFSVAWFLAGFSTLHVKYREVDACSLCKKSIELA